MSVSTVAILSPGDMGHSVGQALGEHGLNVITCLEGRSERTRRLAGRANIRDVGSLDELSSRRTWCYLSWYRRRRPEWPAASLRRCEPPGPTRPRRLQRGLPQTAKAMDATITGAGGRFIDAFHHRRPSRRQSSSSLLRLRADVGVMSELDGKGVDVRFIGEDIGRASASRCATPP